MLLIVAAHWATFASSGGTEAAASPSTVLSVRDFGAVGDGVTDDSAAIRAALRAGSSPRTIVFPPGIYVFAEVVLPSDTLVRFEEGAFGLAPAYVTESDVFFAAVGTEANPARNVSLEGGSFEGRGLMGGVLVAKYADTVTARGVTATNVMKNIGSNLSTNVQVIDCVAEGGRWGFAFERSEHILVSGCESRNTARDGIVFYDRCAYVTAEDNVIEGYMLGGGVGVGGIQVYGSTDAQITGNIVRDGRYDSAGIRFRDSERFWCEGNYIESPGSSGLQVHRVGDFPGLDGGDGTFFNNVVVGAKLRGVDVPNAASKPVRIVGNTITNTTSTSDVSAGMAIVALPPGCVVVGNRIQDATGAGIQVGGSGQVVAWNTIRDVAVINFGPRVGVFVTGTNQAVVENTIVDTQAHMLNGIRTYDGSSALIRGNVISGSTGAPYDIRGAELSVIDGDATPPVISYALDTGSASGRTAVFRATDILSPVAALKVSLDGQEPRVFAGSSAEVPLSAGGAHTLTCWGLDQAGNVSMKVVSVEAQVVEPSTIDIQHDAAGVVFDRWVTGYSTAYSGDGYVYGRWAGTKLTARFTGSKVRWIGPKQPSYGMADVYIDGVLVASDVDCYAPAGSAALETLIWESGTLTDGPHTVELRLKGNRNASSTGNVVVLDRFEAYGAVPAGGGTRFDDADGVLTGSWIPAINPTYYDKTYIYSRWASHAFTMSFTGTRVAWIGPMTPFYGRADVFIDGAKVATVDQYRTTQGWREVVWESNGCAQPRCPHARDQAHRHGQPRIDERQHRHRRDRREAVGGKDSVGTSSRTMRTQWTCEVTVLMSQRRSQRRPKMTTASPGLRGRHGSWRSRRSAMRARARHGTSRRRSRTPARTVQASSTSHWEAPDTPRRCSMP
jgi:hypothetical protein